MSALLYCSHAAFQPAPPLSDPAIVAACRSSNLVIGARRLEPLGAYAFDLIKRLQNRR